MIPLPGWMRSTLLTTGVMNVLVAFVFLPAAASLRALAGLPEGSHPIYLTTVGVFVLAFGVAYLWAAAQGEADRLFVAVAATAKLSVFCLLVRYWSLGALPGRAPLVGAADLVFAMLFLVWLVSARPHRQLA